MKLLIEKTHTESVEVKIPIPIFWKDKTVASEFIAILDEKTAVRLKLIGEDYTCITHATPEAMQSAIVKAHSDYLLSYEQEFLRMYDDALESIRLKPFLIDTEPR